MNRRGFLSFAAAAPVALPLAANAAAKGYASGGYLTGEGFVLGEFVGIDGSGVGPIYGEHSPLNELLAAADKRWAAERMVLSVKQQMIEHDLFEISDHQNVRVPNANG